ncbi:unnamed protein product, partial [Prorocentrum cordatum]
RGFCAVRGRGPPPLVGRILPLTVRGLVDSSAGARLTSRGGVPPLCAREVPPGKRTETGPTTSSPPPPAPGRRRRRVPCGEPPGPAATERAGGGEFGRRRHNGHKLSDVCQKERQKHRARRRPRSHRKARGRRSRGRGSQRPRCSKSWACSVPLAVAPGPLASASGRIRRAIQINGLKTAPGRRHRGRPSWSECLRDARRQGAAA